MRIVIDRLRDRYGNSGRERDEMGIEREREKRKRSRVASYLDKLSFFAVVLPWLFLLSNEKTGEHGRPWKRKRDFENRSLCSLSLSLSFLNRSLDGSRASKSIALIVKRKVDRRDGNLAPFHALTRKEATIGGGRSNSFHDFEINRLSLRDKYNGVNSISSLRFDCHWEIALLRNFTIKSTKDTRILNGIKL